jgi:hypothetical protein
VSASAAAASRLRRATTDGGTRVVKV